MAPNGRVGESAYAEIPEGQTQTNQPDSPNTTDDNANIPPADENHETPCLRGGNQYHEITDLLQAEHANLPPPPCPDSHLPVESNGYAYAYIDGKALPRGEGCENADGSANVELKGSRPNAKYAEVHKNKDRHHPKSPGSSGKEKQVATKSDREKIPKTIQAYITHIPSAEGDAESTVETDNQNKEDEPYGNVEIGSRIPESSEYDLVQMTDGKLQFKDAGDGSEAYDELGPTPSTTQESKGYNKFKRSISRENSIDLCEDDIPSNSGYGLVLGEAEDLEKVPESNHYASLEGHGHGNETAGSPPRPPQSRGTYDRLDRQISTTSMPHGSPTKSRKTLQKDSPHYSKLSRSTSRQDASATLPAGHTGYGVVGDKGHHGTMPPQAYDTLNTDTLASQVPVQDIYDFGSSGPLNENGAPNSMSAEQIPEGPYATIPSDVTPPSQTYDKLQRAKNDVVNQNQAADANGIQDDDMKQGKNASSIYDTPDSSLNRQDTLYENTPKRKQQEAQLSGRNSSNATYDAPSSRSSLEVQDSESARIPPNITYDTPSRNSVTRQESESLSTPVNSTYDMPTSRNSLARQDSTYDSPTSHNPIGRQDSLYENAAKTRKVEDKDKPVQYEHMEKGNRISNASTGSYYEDMHRGNRSSRLGSRSSRSSASLDASVPSPFAQAQVKRQDTLYENTARDKKK